MAGAALCGVLPSMADIYFLCFQEAFSNEKTGKDQERFNCFVNLHIEYGIRARLY
jgi:hypothetical protein